MNVELADVYRAGQAEGYGQVLKQYFGTEGAVTQEQLKAAVFKMGEISGKSLAESHRSGLVAFTSAGLTDEEARALYSLKIPTSFYPESNHGIFTEQGLDKLLTYMAKVDDSKITNQLSSINAELSSSVGDVIWEELNLQSNENHDFANVPFFIKSPVASTVDCLVKNSTQNVIQELELFDIGGFLHTEREERDEQYQQAHKLLEEDSYSTVHDTLNLIFYQCVNNKLNKQQATKAIINLQKIVRYYAAQAESALDGDPNG